MSVQSLPKGDSELHRNAKLYAESLTETLLEHKKKEESVQIRVPQDQCHLCSNQRKAKKNPC